MISTVHLNNKLLFQTNEIHDVITYYVLSDETLSYSTSTQLIPQDRLRQSLVLTVLTCISLKKVVSIRISCLKHSYGISKRPPPYREGEGRVLIISASSSALRRVNGMSMSGVQRPLVDIMTLRAVSD